MKGNYKILKNLKEKFVPFDSTIGLSEIDSNKSKYLNTLYTLVKLQYYL